MKKSILLFGAVALMLATSCNEKKSETTEMTETTTTVVDTVDNDMPPPPPPPPVAEEADGTSVSVNSDGVSVNTKDGTNKTQVEVKGNGGTVEIKK